MGSQALVTAAATTARDGVATLSKLHTLEWKWWLHSSGGCKAAVWLRHLIAYPRRKRGGLESCSTHSTPPREPPPRYSRPARRRVK